MQVLKNHESHNMLDQRIDGQKDERPRIKPTFTADAGANTVIAVVDKRNVESTLRLISGMDPSVQVPDEEIIYFTLKSADAQDVEKQLTDAMQETKEPGPGNAASQPQYTAVLNEPIFGSDTRTNTVIAIVDKRISKEVHDEMARLEPNDVGPDFGITEGMIKGQLPHTRARDPVLEIYERMLVAAFGGPVSSIPLPAAISAATVSSLMAQSVTLNVPQVVAQSEDIGKGFIEYGGTSFATPPPVATALVPWGLTQPSDDVPQILNTNFTFADGTEGPIHAEIAPADDKVPVLGDLPLIGRLFQSNGEISQSVSSSAADVTAPETSPVTAPPEITPAMKKLGEIVIPLVNIDTPTPLDEVIATFAALSQKYDKEGIGVNFHVSAPPNGAPMPKVKMVNLRDISLKTLLDMACRDANYGYFDDNGIIEVSQGSGSVMGTTAQFETKVFPMPRNLFISLFGGSNFQNPTIITPQGGNSGPLNNTKSLSLSDMEQRLTDFFQRAGIEFPAGASLAYTPGEIQATNTPKNLEMIGNLLQKYNPAPQIEKYNPTPQIEVEAFLLGVPPGSPPPSATHAQYPEKQTLTSSAPADKNYLMNNLDWLSQSAGSDLLSAPKIVCMSGHEANISIAGEIKLPSESGPTEFTAGPAKGSGGVWKDTVTPTEYDGHGMEIGVGSGGIGSGIGVGVKIDIFPTVTGNTVIYSLHAILSSFLGFSEIKVGDANSGHHAALLDSREMATSGQAEPGQPMIIPMGTYTGGIFSYTPPATDGKTTPPSHDLYLIITFNIISPGGVLANQQVATPTAAAP